MSDLSLDRVLRIAFGEWAKVCETVATNRARVAAVRMGSVGRVHGPGHPGTPRGFSPEQTVFLTEQPNTA